MYCTHMFTWEPVSNLDCPEIIEAYEKNKEDKTTEEKENQELKQEVKREANDTKQALLKRPKKKSKKVRKEYGKPL